jgi:LPXTG-motif cell wall-anchored protein
VNDAITVELPETGGPGTLLYTMLGMMLIALAGTAYMILLRRRRASLKGGDNLR